MDVKTIKKTAICRENGEEFYIKWFSNRKDKTFIKHVDTLYYMVTPDIEDLTKSEEWQKFIKYLLEMKEKAERLDAQIPVFTDVREGLEAEPFKGAGRYSCHFGIEDRFDVFVCTYVLNDDTPSIQVQIRSNTLWIDGMKNAFDTSYGAVAAVINSFGIKIKKIQENRIDYAHHTNYINNMLNFFKEEDLGKMFVANFKRGRKDYDLHNNEEDEYGDREVTSDYVTLGRLKSNNVFFRAYNKTKEVIEQGYKQFFIPIWKDYGLINDFDVWVLERAFKQGTYESKDRARCEFYHDYGKDDDLRKEIYEKLSNPDTPTAWFAKKAKGLVPDITIITNVEIQTKRKFYDRIMKNMPMFTSEESPKKNMYNIFEQMSEIIRFITDDTIRFVNYKGKNAKIHRTKRPMADWWVRLRSAKSVEINDLWVIDYIRQYEYSLNLERQKLLTIGKTASMGAYLNVSTGMFKVARADESEKDIRKRVNKDFQKIYENMNDNDFRKYKRKQEKKTKELLKRLNE